MTDWLTKHTDQPEAAAAEFLRVPKVTWHEWLDLTDESRNIMIEAAEKVELERAMLVATLMGADEHRIARAKSLAGDDSHLIGVAMRDALDVAEKRLT